VNPEPVSVTVLRASPLKGLNVSVGVTVNVPAAVIVPSTGVDAAIAYELAEEAGTVIVHVKEPSLTTSTGPPLHDELVPPKYGVTGSAAVNPDPTSPTPLPTIPLSGPNVSSGVTAKDPAAVTVPSSNVDAAMA
jgi:hypothetical protein